LLSKFLTAVSAAAILYAGIPASAQTDSAAAPAPPAAAPPAAEAAVPPSPGLVANGDIAATLKASPHFSILSKVLDASNLTSVLKSTPNITLFAPTDEAFNALPPAELAMLMETKNAPLLQKILTYHLVNLMLDSSKIKGAKGPVDSVEGSKLNIDGSGSPLKVDSADIIQTDVRASNGLIQVVDKVLLPPDVTIPTADSGGAAPAN
jgi:uncharacterized surface protein with fasciclin (FAS1) repeats